VKVADMKTIVKKVKKDYTLAKELFDTGNGDAMYLAGLIADETKMTKADLEKWAKQATWHWNSEYSVPWVASETKFGWELGMKWIDSKQENVASCGWSTLSSYINLTPNDKLDLKTIEKLMTRAIKELPKGQNRVAYTMNGFLICVAGIPEFTAKVIEATKKIGPVEIDMGGTACKVPYAPDYIAHMKKMGRLGKKRKSARC